MREPSDPEWAEFQDAEIVDWKRVRSAIEHENHLTNHRFTWLLTSQGFLFAAFALLFQASTKVDVLSELRGFYRVVLAALGFSGMLIAIYLHLGLRAAQIHHNRLRDWWLARPDTNLHRHPPICGTDFGRPTEVFSYYRFPFVLFLAWLALVPIVLWEDLKPHAGSLGYASLTVVAAVGLVLLGVLIGRRRRESVPASLPGPPTQARRRPTKRKQGIKEAL